MQCNVLGGRRAAGGGGANYSNPPFSLVVPAQNAFAGHSRGAALNCGPDLEPCRPVEPLCQQRFTPGSWRGCAVSTGLGAGAAVFLQVSYLTLSLPRTKNSLREFLATQNRRRHFV